MTDAMNDLDSYLDGIEENGEHLAILVGLRYQVARDGRNWHVFKFQITDDANPLDGEEYERWIQDHSHLNIDDYNTLPGKEKSLVRKHRKNLTDFLISLGYSEDEAISIRKFPKENPDADAQKGIEVWITISVSSYDEKTFKNINKVKIVTEDDGNPENPPF